MRRIATLLVACALIESGACGEPSAPSVDLARADANSAPADLAVPTADAGIDLRSMDSEGAADLGSTSVDGAGDLASMGSDASADLAPGATDASLPVDAAEPPPSTQWLAAHNAVRANATPTPSPALPALIWSDAAAAAAQAWVDKCDALASHGAGYGANTALNAQALPVAQVVGLWAAEAANYDYASDTCPGGQCGSYRGLVWRGTVSLGCAHKRCTTNPPFGYPEVWACYYTPSAGFGRPY